MNHTIKQQRSQQQMMIPPVVVVSYGRMRSIACLHKGVLPRRPRQQQVPTRFSVAPPSLVSPVPPTTRRSLVHLTKQRRRRTNQTSKRPRPRTSNTTTSSSNNSSSISSNKLESLGPYGLTKVDYQRHPPPRWPLPPPPPPPRNPFRRYFPVATFLLATTIGVYIYFHQDENVYEYWRQVEQGNVPLEGDHSDQDDDDDDDDGDEWDEDDSDENRKT